MKIQALPKEIRPREKAKSFGIESLSDSELLALLIRSGISGLSALDIASDLLKTYGSISSLSNANYSSLISQKGLKETRVLNLLGVFEFHKRLNMPIYQKIEKIIDNENLYKRYRHIGQFDQEVFILVMLDKKRSIIKERTLYKGTSENTIINLKEIITELVVSKCSLFYMIHNHPDDQLIASKDDEISTNYIRLKAEELDIELLDHIIIGKSGFYSIFKRQIFQN